MLAVRWIPRGANLAQMAAHRESVVDAFWHLLPDRLGKVEAVDRVEVLKLIAPAEHKEFAASPHAVQSILIAVSYRHTQQGTQSDTRSTP